MSGRVYACEYHLIFSHQVIFFFFDLLYFDHDIACLKYCILVGDYRAFPCVLLVFKSGGFSGPLFDINVMSLSHIL